MADWIIDGSATPPSDATIEGNSGRKQKPARSLGRFRHRSRQIRAECVEFGHAERCPTGVRTGSRSGCGVNFR